MEKTSPYLVESIRSGVKHAVTVAADTDTARPNDALRLLGAISPEVRDWCATLRSVSMSLLVAVDIAAIPPDPGSVRTPPHHETEQ